MFKPLSLAVLSGCLLPLALPNEFLLMGNPWIGFICLSPLFYALATRDSPFEAAITGAVFGAVSTFISNYWLMHFKDFALLTIGSVTAAYAFLFIFFSGFLWRFSRFNPVYRPFLMAAFWTVYEFIKSTGYLAYPWGLIPYPIHEWLPLLQIVDIAGIWPLSFLMALSNALFAELLLLGPFGPLKSFRVFQRQGLFFVSLLSLFLVYGILRMSMHPPVLGTLKTVLVQQNTDPWIDDSGGKNLMQAQALSRDGVKKLGGKADLIVWSESSLSRPYADSLSYYERYPRGDPFVGFVREMGTFVLVGTPIVRDRQLRLIQNGVVLLNSQAEIVDSYGKRHPVPIAENVPFWEYEPVRKFFQNVIGLGGIWDLGNRDTIFSVFTSKGEKISFGVPICFEDAFPYICGRFVKKGADLLVNITNDSWSRQNSAQVQHFVAARFRSIELKRVLVRSTNGGLTAVIGPFGEIMAELPMFTPQFLAVEIPVYKEDRMTPYALFGDYLPILLAAILTVLLLYDVLLALITKKNRR